MNKKNIFSNLDCDAILIPSCDEFLSEYVKQDCSLMYFLSGFNGSNGIIVLCKNRKNILFTDGRYILQAESQLNVNEWEVYDFVNLTIKQKLYDEKISKIAMISDYFSQKQLNNYAKDFKIIKITKEKIFQIICFNPNILKSKVFLHEDNFSGCGYQEKLNKIRKKLNSVPYFITDSSSICWLLNIRGEDLPHTPIINCFAIIDNNTVYIFGNFENTIKLENIEYKNFSEIELVIKKYTKINITLDEINSETYEILQRNLQINDIMNPILIEKCIKNSIQVNGFKMAHTEDALAMEKLITWVKENQGNITELDVVEKSLEFRKYGEKFHSLSFDTIAGFNENGAIIHYKPNEITNKTIIGDGILLIDSGGQYKNGTTDVTRTIAIGNPEKKFPNIKFHYTLVLKALQMLSNLHFPINTSGGQLDAIARYNLWQNGLDYQHGTGHGVGYFLSVHEGPCGISKSLFANQIKLETGMILSIEPGLYFPNEYGIRLENLVVVVESNKFKNFLMFETLTKVAFDEKLIDENLL